MIPYIQQYETALSNFEYVQDINQFRVLDRWHRSYDIRKHFRGDCEDFAFTLQYEIGGQVWYVILPRKVDNKHAVLVKDNWVYDNLHKHPVKLENYNGDFVGYFKYEYHTINILGKDYKLKQY